MKKLFLMAWLVMLSMAAWSQKLSLLNDHTAQLQLPSGHYLYIDFYASDIFRLFLDPQGGEMRDPQATPPAQILADNPRRDGASIRVVGGQVKSSSIALNVDAQTGASRWSMTASCYALLPP
ncbi:MAG: hypothetical protein KBT12_02680, partial [Bacteroidales bacterium]|nr:hypothetical protein [Candidatus Physcousia equi]